MYTLAGWTGVVPAGCHCWGWGGGAGVGVYVGGLDVALLAAIAGLPLLG